MKSRFKMGLLEGFLPVEMGIRQKRYTTQRPVHTKVKRLMTVNSDPMECTAISTP